MPLQFIPDDRGIFDTAYDPHGAFALRAYQRIDFIYLLNKLRPVPPVNFFIPLWFENASYKLQRKLFSEDPFFSIDNFIFII